MTRLGRIKLTRIAGGVGLALGAVLVAAPLSSDAPAFMRVGWSALGSWALVLLASSLLLTSRASQVWGNVGQGAATLTAALAALGVMRSSMSLAAALALASGGTGVSLATARHALVRSAGWGFSLAGFVIAMVWLVDGALGLADALRIAGYQASSLPLMLGIAVVTGAVLTADDAGALRRANAGLEERVRSRTRELAASEQRLATTLESIGDALTNERAAEEALRASETKYKNLYETHPDMCVTVDVETERIVDCNRTVLHQLGYSREDLLALTLDEIYDSSVTAMREGAHEAFERDRELRDRERVLRRRDGSTLEVSLNVTAMRGGDGRLYGHGVWRDISARKQAERDQKFLADLGDIQSRSLDPTELMYELSRRLGHYLKASRANFLDVHLSAGTLEIKRAFCNGVKAIEGVFDLARFGVESRREQEAGHTTIVSDARTDPRTAARYETAYALLDVAAYITVPLVRSGLWVGSLSVSSREPRQWQEREVALVRRVAEHGWLLVEQHQLAALIREREAKELMRRTDERFRALVEAVKDYAIYLVDAVGIVQTWNVGAEHLKGYSEHEIVGKPVDIFYTEEDRARSWPAQVLARAAEKGSYHEEGWRVRKDGTRIWASVTVTALCEDGQLAGFVKVTRDMSERHSAEQLLLERQRELTAHVREREVLLQEVHHRVKNNLQVISSLINMQMRQVKDAGALSALDECRARVSAIALIHEKLYQAKDYASIPFSDYARHLSRSIFHAAGIDSSQVQLKLDIEETMLPVDRAIPCGLILNELITNALKHAFPAARAGQVHVEFRKLDSGVLLAVTDDGIGIPAEFDANKTASLGMQLVTTLAEQLEGRLEVRRHPGAEFRVLFPFEAS